jgi:hypothetical protein
MDIVERSGAYCSVHSGLIDACLPVGLLGFL